jgi:hypothetical protein
MDPNSEKICKYCRESNTDIIKRKICACRGSVGSVCRSCLKQYIVINQTKRCPECRSKFLNIKFITGRVFIPFWDFIRRPLRQVLFDIIESLFISISYYILYRLFEKGLIAMIAYIIHFAHPLIYSMLLMVSYIDFLYARKSKSVNQIVDIEVILRKRRVSNRKSKK